VVAREPITAVGNGGCDNEWLKLHDRPDVREVFPEWPHAVGFQGVLGAGALEDGNLQLQVGVSEDTHRETIPLSPVPPPPDHLQVRQVGSVWGERFYPAGREIFDEIAEAFADGGHPLTTARRVLDFGCGCGRVLRSFAQVNHTGEIWGCDIDAESIAWNEANLDSLGQFATNPSEPPTTWEDQFFDAIYTVSVFTHLPEDLQLAWVRELHRLLDPNGLLVASVHGEHYWRQDPGVAAEVAQQGFAYRTGEVTQGLPEFYMVAYHSIEYIKREWGRWFEVVAHHPQHISKAHDAVVLRRRADT
jgi:SAM-dependent methyltransferase